MLGMNNILEEYTMADKVISFLCRIFFIIALVMLLIAIWDRILNAFGWTLTFISYQPARLLELSALLMIFVIALLLRQIRDRLQNK